MSESFCRAVAESGITSPSRRCLLGSSSSTLFFKALISLNTTVTNVERVFRHLIGEDIDVVFHLDENLDLVSADASLLEQVVLNLVVNAAHAIEEGQVANNTIALSTATDADGNVVIMVRDSGEGIDPTELEHIFGSFRQVDSTTTREQDGAGLGLALCRDFCRRLRGDLTVRSTPGKGSEFTVILPVTSSLTRIEEILPMEILDLWANVEPELQAATSLEEAAQVLASGLHTRLSESTVLVRVFVTVDMAEVPDGVRNFVTALADTAQVADDLHDSTRVLSLVGTSGSESDWNDRRLSQDHSGIPLISGEFVEGIPMMSSLLGALGLPLDWMEQDKANVVQQTIGQSAGLFFVESAALATDDQGRKIIPAQDFVNHYGVRSVFGLGCAYPGDEILVVIVFCTEQFPKAVAERFLPLLTLFKGATAWLLSEGRIFTT